MDPYLLILLLYLHGPLPRVLAFEAFLSIWCEMSSASSTAPLHGPSIRPWANLNFVDAQRPPPLARLLYFFAHDAFLILISLVGRPESESDLAACAPSGR